MLQDIENEKILLSRQQRLKAAPFLMNNMSPDLAQYVLTGQGFETYGELVLPVYSTIFSIELLLCLKNVVQRCNVAILVLVKPIPS